MRRPRWIPWWFPYLAIIALAHGGFVLRDHGLEKWAALLDSIALTILLNPLIRRVLGAARRRSRC